LKEFEKNKMIYFLQETPAKVYSFWKVYGLSRTGNEWGCPRALDGEVKLGLKSFRIDINTFLSIQTELFQQN